LVGHRSIERDRGVVALEDPTDEEGQLATSGPQITTEEKP
jgi:hypothetical protein